MQEESVISAQWKFVLVVASMIAVGSAPTMRSPSSRASGLKLA